MDIVEQELLSKVIANALVCRPGTLLACKDILLQGDDSLPDYSMEEALEAFIASLGGKPEKTETAEQKKARRARGESLYEPDDPNRPNGYHYLLRYHIRRFYAPIGDARFPRTAQGAVWCKTEREALAKYMGTTKNGACGKNKTVRYLRQFWAFCGKENESESEEVPDGLDMTPFKRNLTAGKPFKMKAEPKRHKNVNENETKIVVAWFRERFAKFCRENKLLPYKNEALRDLVFIGCIYHSGIRPCEAVALRRAQIDSTALAEGALTIEEDQTKTGTDDRRIILLPLAGTPERMELETYLAMLDARFPGKADLPLFPVLRGKAKGSRPIKAGNIQKNVVARKMRPQTGIREDWGIYAIRHNKATQLARAGGNAYTISAIMGHRSMDTTKKYIHMDAKTLVEQNARYHPTT